MAKYIFVTGGVVSGIGKGIIASSVGRLLKNRGLNIFMQKFDPYINVDPGTMSPYQHGEVFVTKDGAETDLDLGHYERFIDVELTQNANITTGRVYQSVIRKERNGEYDGATVQVIPHITDEIKNKIYAAAKESNADVVITEIGGTVGDIESLPFLEAIRQVYAENPENDVIFIHTTLIPKVPASNEFKTKPTQHSFKELMSQGIKADVIVTRCDEPLEGHMKEKIALFCDVHRRAIIESRNVDNLYRLPLLFQEQGLDEIILKKLDMQDLPEADMSTWIEMIESTENLKHSIEVALVGKYVELHDAYLSITEALYHAGFVYSSDVKIRWIDSEELKRENVKEKLSNVDAVLVPSAFADKGIDGKLIAIAHAREENIPLLGIGLGMQLMAIDFARNICGLEEAHSLEFEKTEDPVITLLENGFRGEENIRLGNFPCKIKKDSLVAELYQVSKDPVVFERHRNRYEFNNQYRDIFEEKGMVFSGISPDGQIVEIIEYPKQDFHIGCIFHPEFKSRPNKAHPLFKGFVKSALHYSQKGSNIKI